MLIQFLRTSCKFAIEQTGNTLVSKDVLYDLALDAGYNEEDVHNVLDPLPALVKPEYFKI